MNEKVYSGMLELGGTIHLFNRDWIVCHIEDGKYYLGAKEIESKVEFGKTNKYANSNLLKVVIEYQDQLTKKYPTVVNNHLVDVTVNGVTAKVFAPSKNQLGGDFDYFKNDENRICKYHGQPDWYWTSSPISGPFSEPFSDNTVYYVDEDGWYYLCSNLNSDLFAFRGFRPFVCFKP